MEKQLAEVAVDVATNPSVLGWYEAGWLGCYVAIATLIGIARAQRDHDYDSLANLFALGICSGGAGLVCVCFVGGSLGGVVGYELLLLGLAAGSALTGRSIEMAIRRKVEDVLRVERNENDEV